jgi:hypothetical protein
VPELQTVRLRREAEEREAEKRAAREQLTQQSAGPLMATRIR